MIRLLLPVFLVAVFVRWSGPASGAERDPLSMLPPDALIVAEWRGLSPDGGIVRTVSAAAGAPVLREMMGMEADEIAAAGRLMERVLRHPGAMSFHAEGDMPGLILVVNAGNEAEQILEAIIGLRSGGKHEDAPKAMGGIDWHFFQSDDGSPRFAAHQGRFVFATSEKHAQAAAQTLTNAAAPNLASDVGLKAAAAAAPKTESAWRMSTWVNVGGLIALAGEAAGSEGSPFPAAVGVNGLQWGYLRIDGTPHGDRIYARLQAEKLEGALRGMLAQKPVTDASVECIPADAYYAYTFTFNLRGLFDDVMSTVEAIDEDAHQQATDGLTLVGQFLGFGVTDLLDCFGDNWTMYDSPAHGGLLFTGHVLVAEVKDAAALQGILARMVQISGAAVGAFTSSIRIAEREYTADGRSVHYVAVSGLPIPIAPAWTVVGDRCVFALFPQTAAAAARQADPALRKGSLKDVAEYQRLRPLLPKEATGLWYVNGREQLRATHGLWQLIATALANMAGGREGAMTIEQLPTYAQRQAAMRSTLGAFSCDANGWSYVAYGDSAPGMVVEGGTLTNLALLSSIFVPSLFTAREHAKEAVSMQNLRAIGVACHMYANDHEDRFPRDLNELVEFGAVTRGGLRSPRDPETNPASPSYVYISGQSLSDDPRNILAYEPARGDGRAIALYVDSHVEILSAAELEVELDRTRERMKRKVAP
ncbi:MAG: hypothetical protein IPM64_07280 [Phycisphaerales bacterium]|nr:hypothetical protein [Phycisphaerales bacterium]